MTGCAGGNGGAVQVVLETVMQERDKLEIYEAFGDLGFVHFCLTPSSMCAMVIFKIYMEPKKEEALRAKENAEKLFAQKAFVGAKKFASKAQTLYPELEDKAKLKKQYRKMAVLLHPYKNESVGVDGAFKLVSEALTLLSDRNKKGSYDLRRNKQLSSVVVQTNTSLAHTAGVTGFDNSSKSSDLNKRLSCKNCRGVFIAVETGAAPVNGSFPYCPWSYVADSGYGGHGFNGVTYVRSNAIYFAGNGVMGFHSGHGSECVPNLSFQWSSLPGAPAGVVDPNGLTTKSAYITHQANVNTNETRANGKHHMNKAGVDTGSNMFSGYNEPSASKAGRATKKRKVDVEGISQSGNEAVPSNTASEVRLVNGNGSIRHNSRLSISSKNQTRRCSAAPAFDARKLLIEKARTEIRKRLEEIRLVSTAAAVAEENEKVLIEVAKFSEAPTRASLDGPSHQSELKKTMMIITVPDSDLHDFDKDRAEECFKPKQIWALYDEEDGMPHLYCLIRQVISVKPFKIHISYLNSKTDSEFGSVNWVDYGFSKSCGNFRAWNSEIVDQVNIFSHLLSREKAGRGGCVRIYPKSADVWAIYRNWSPDWNRTTPNEVRHQYEMVEVLDDYSEEPVVCVTPLVKLNGFKTVYQRNSDRDAVKWIPRREMLRFSHQVPSCLLKGDSSNLQLPDRFRYQQGPIQLDIAGTGRITS
ncbi:hypothetical protein F0562_011276 [Nyssa sinensis]|uniref:J domain-containing protein n=1 Tax=Nyssa sinensis TaxID=561372 RepID=A0A5J5A1T6_9ASTE|nr:hypothetical protein F0562_011276 [Nyssa sinensis]